MVRPSSLPPSSPSPPHFPLRCSAGSYTRVRSPCATHSPLVSPPSATPFAPASSPFTTSAILGYGINIAQDSDHLATPQATSLYAEGDAEAGADPTSVSHTLLAQILTGLDSRIRGLVAHGNAHDCGLADEAANALPLLGTRIALAKPTDPNGHPAMEGVALGLSPTGSLLVATDDGRTHDINAGDVLATGIPLTTVHDTKEKRANN